MLKVGDKVISLLDMGFITKGKVYTILSISIIQNTYKLVESSSVSTGEYREYISYRSDCFTLCTDLTKSLT